MKKYDELGPLDKHPVGVKIEKWIIEFMKKITREGGDSQAKQLSKALIKVNKLKRPKPKD